MVTLKMAVGHHPSYNEDKKLEQGNLRQTSTEKLWRHCNPQSMSSLCFMSVLLRYGCLSALHWIDNLLMFFSYAEGNLT